jgi:TolA-binding protein
MILFFGLISQLLLNDFELGKKYFERGDYQIARSFLEEFVKDRPESESVPEAEFYLIKIADHDRNFTGFWGLAQGFLNTCLYNPRRQEIFNLLLTRLVEKGSCLVAFDYLKKYDYLQPDSLLLYKITRTLLEQMPGADSVWQACPQTDTFRILRALAFAEPSPRDDLYRKVGGLKGPVMRMENYLQFGDTIYAYFRFRETRENDIPVELRYRYTKIARLFDREIFERSLAQLRSFKGVENRAALLEALETGRLAGKITPQDDEEVHLLAALYAYDSTSPVPPESVNTDSLWADTAGFDSNLENLRRAYPSNFYLDSVYAEALMARGRYADAGQAVGKYLTDRNVQRYARMVRAFASFIAGDYGSALKDLILSQSRSGRTKFFTAECLEQTGQDGREYYRAALAAHPDSAFRYMILKKLLPLDFRRGNFPAVASFSIDSLSGDTGLIRIGLKSRARTGAAGQTDSLYQAIFGGYDPDYMNCHGEHLIETKAFGRARALYDSLVASTAALPSDAIFFNWALIPFQTGDYDTAQIRFHFFTAQFKNRPRYEAALFKLATIKYQLGDFDSAGYYYRRAAADSLLRHDALKNGIISDKRAEAWKDLINTAQNFLSGAGPEEKSDAFFEIGYAYLRMGNFRKGIEFLKQAVTGISQPEFHYWLAEAYLGRGDFIRALYQYQVIVNKFPKDEMWGPTAEFKSGLALEFLDQTEEAKKLYEGIIKRRGKADVWGAEAVKRLELMK